LPNKIFKNWWEKIKYNYFQEFILLVVLLVLGTIFSLLTDTFLTIPNMLNVLLQISIIAILGFGVTIIIISAGIDLSLGSVMALVGMGTAAILTSSTPSIFLAILGGLLIGGIVGFINGITVAYIHLPAFIATLAMMSIARGVALVVTSAIPIYNLPESFLFLGSGFLWGVPTPIYIMISLYFILDFILRKTKFGRYTYAIGGNEEATRLSGINIKRYKLLVYVVGGICTGVAGILFTARLGSGQPTAGVGYELDAITAAILGGTNLFGGSGNLIGTLIGAFVMGVINNGQALLNISSYVQNIVRGIIVILAVGISTYQYMSRK
jgi:ribose transport system permease protein